MRNKLNMPIISFAAKQIFLLAGAGLLLLNMLLPAVAGVLDEPNSFGDKTMSEAQKHADKETPIGRATSIATNTQQGADKGDAQPQKKQPEATNQTPYPFTADELWEKLLKVVELPEGHVTKEQVESIFGVTLKLDEEYLKKFQGHLYNLKTEYLYLGFVENSATESHFEFKWGQIPGQRRAVFPRPPSGMCIKALKIMPGIELRGWELKRETRNIRDILDRNDYRKGKMGVLRMEFFPRDNCLASIDIFTDKLADQFIR